LKRNVHQKSERANKKKEQNQLMKIPLFLGQKKKGKKKGKKDLTALKLYLLLSDYLLNERDDSKKKNLSTMYDK